MQSVGGEHVGMGSGGGGGAQVVVRQHQVTIQFQSGVVRQAVTVDPRTLCSLSALRELAREALERTVFLFFPLHLPFSSLSPPMPSSHSPFHLSPSLLPPFAFSLSHLSFSPPFPFPAEFICVPFPSYLHALNYPL